MIARVFLAPVRLATEISGAGLPNVNRHIPCAGFKREKPRASSRLWPFAMTEERPFLLRVLLGLLVRSVSPMVLLHLLPFCQLFGRKDGFDLSPGGSMKRLDLRLLIGGG